MKIAKAHLDEMLKLHKKWLNDEAGGKKLVICDADISEADLYGADLRHAAIIRTNLHAADLRKADLREASIYLSCLQEANLADAVLCGADLNGVDLREVDLSRANLKEALLSDANLYNAVLRQAILSGADLRGTNLDYASLPLWCGSLEANFDDKQIIQLLFHAVRAGLGSKNVSAEIKQELEKMRNLANKFHRIDECGIIERVEIELPKESKS